MRGQLLRRTWPFALWLIALALLPWWLGLPLLLGIAAVLLAGVERLQVIHGTLRLALRWGLPGVMLALARWVDEPALAWTIAAVGALAGFTLLAGLESWLDRGRRKHRSTASPTDTGTEWPQLALAPMRAGSGIIELTLPHWQLDDASGEDDVRYVHEPGFAGYAFADGKRIAMPPARRAVAPGGRWLAWELRQGVLLWDRERRRSYRLRRRHLCGWYDGQPWLQGGEADMPVPLREALGREHDD
jgi:hypothetical protein